MSITTQDVEKIAQLANLRPSPADLDRLAAQMDAIVGYFDRLNELDTTDLPPMAHCTAVGDTALRPDTPHTPPGSDVALANAPEAGHGHFKVPRVI
ncbi:Asp-tRNA(Asn)/Glu-tRNA(Gln) amidotransferase subunit GatC [Chloracidobacterium validum]|uniref:Aspartyl/glutamyl-tRNA(Asn/Gln) amidotransferase subunit C n=1 Tax=Chloracidobacterium validum TaxID=2821543 RepID=A0ABX8B929_9BACT|nr:Asp-tRNA(Asn)/Glu-tRNA(Gln) amidotransferase subunit GatC [Chloracidobacterium validum]QUW02143.1 Asp-tRNA(Asn)/Glu-tRNA(Gln) amidotransferase subunit GatC [Chloracidobacterium validum]